MLKKLRCLALLTMGATGLFCQNPWSDVPEGSFKSTGERWIVPQKYRALALDLPALEAVLDAAPERFSPQSLDNEVFLQLPMPDGQMAAFRITESAVMEKSLQGRYPDIRCYTGTGLDDPTAFLKCDLTPAGFHAMILSSRTGTVFIDPYARGERGRCVSYFKKDYLRPDKHFRCELDGDALATDSGAKFFPGAEFQGDCQMRKYRLALACTGEYANFHGSTGTNKAPALAAMNTSMNRVNGVYERDFAVTMVIIANNDLLIYTNSGSDPYTNNSGGTMLGQNKTTLTNVIGAANYDIGHVFSTGGGGVAGLGVICGSDKARGVTGSGQPVGDGFDIDYVAHEMGHQFGGNHTFNSNVGACSGNQAGPAMEPGSGTTIMAYAGICGAHDIAPHSDDHFHAISLQEISTYIVGGAGNSCPVKTVTGNHAPTVEAGNNRTIPKSTPFALTAVATDQDGNNLTYCWEQMDPETATMPPVATNTAGPMFRSFPPSVSPTRWFPRLQDVINNANPVWEKLPSVQRNMKFRVTVRDNFATAGCTEEDDLTVMVSAAAGPFLVTEPNTSAVVWYIGSTASVTWAVANTTAAPINCANVKISLSTDGGFTYPLVLAENVPNSGSVTVPVPNNASNTCRVKVEAVGNIFYDISNQNFKIQNPPTPTFLMSTSVPDVFVCAGETASFSVNLNSLLSFNDPVQLTLSGLPAGTNVDFSPNPAAPLNSPTVPVTLSGFTPAMAGNYTLTLTGTSGSTVQTSTLGLLVKPGEPAAVVAPTSPADGAGGQATNVNLAWAATAGAEIYEVQVSTNPDFAPSNIIFSGSPTAASQAVGGLSPATIYYWRVEATNTCGRGGPSPTFAFQTGKVACNQTFTSANVPVFIDSLGSPTVSSALAVPDGKLVNDVNISASIAHTYVGDLIAWLESPAGRTVPLFHRPGQPLSEFGCSGNNITATFDDETNIGPNVFENACANAVPTINGTFRPLAPLNRFDGENALGDWKLHLRDTVNDDGGNLLAWSLNFCFADPILKGQLLVNDVLTVPTGGTRFVPTSKLSAQISGASAQAIFVLLSLPAHGNLLLNGLPLALGGTFSQANIDANQVAYAHDGSAPATDEFVFDVVDNTNNAWFHGGLFRIAILQNTLSVNALQSGEILCSGQPTGAVEVNVSGGTAPFTYRLNGGQSQNSNVFPGLLAGTFSILVTDANGFTATTNAVQIAAPAALDASANVTDNDLTASATGGTGAVAYSLDGQNFGPDNVFLDLANGQYILTVRDANGCTATATALVAVDALLAFAEILVPVKCPGDLDGSISVTVSGGLAPYLFRLNGGDLQPSNEFSGLAPGTYDILVEDNAGQTFALLPVILEEPVPISATASVNLNSISVDASGGAAPLEFSLDGTDFQPGNTFLRLPNGDYVITVRDANGCLSTVNVTVAVAVLDASVVISAEILCAGGGASLSVSISGGIPPYEFALDANPYQNANIFLNIAAGPHDLHVRDAVGTIFVIENFEVAQPTAVEVSSGVLANDITAVPSGGTPPYQLALSNGVPPPFDNLPNGQFTIVATDANGCTATATATVNYTPLNAGTQIAAPKCAGESTGRITVAVTGGVSPFEYSLDGTVFQSAAVFNGLPAGQYEVTVRDAAGDLRVVSGLQIVDPQPIVFAPANQVGASLLVSATGGTGQIRYSLDGGTFQVSGTFANVAPGTHTVRAKDANDCIAVLEVVVAVPPLVTAVSDVSGTCFGETKGSAKVCVNGGVGPFTHIYAPAGGNVVVGSSVTCGQTLSFSSMPPGVYAVILTDAEGTTSSVSFTISENPEISVSATTNGINSLTINALGGTPPFKYKLNNGNYQTLPTFPGIANNTPYTMTVQDAAGCTASTSLVETVEIEAVWGVQLSPNPSNGLFQISAKNLPGGGLRLRVFDAAGRQLRNFSMENSGATVTQTLDLQGLPAGTYLLQMTDGQRAGAVRLAIF